MHFECRYDIGELCNIWMILINNQGVIAIERWLLNNEEIHLADDVFNEISSFLFVMNETFDLNEGQAQVS
jgi:hypothetical protein